MTEKKITYTLNRIKTCKKDGYPLEALINSYHLNVELIKFIFSTCSPGHNFENKKIKALVSEFLEETNSNEKLRTIINKKSIKSLKPWLTKTDQFFKSLKLHAPGNVSSLQDETEKIFGLLKISANKLFVKK